MPQFFSPTSKSISPETIQKLSNKEWRMNNLYKIVNEQSKLVTFRPNAAQRHFQQNKHTRNILLKSRRLGMTTYATIDSLDNTLFSRNFNSLLLSYDDVSAKKVFDQIAMLSWAHFPLSQFYKIDASNANMLKIDMGDKTFSVFEVKSSGRGGRTNQIHVSEFGKICAKYPQKAREIISGTIPSLVPDGELTIESTAEGSEGEFHDMYWNAVEATTKRPNSLLPHEYKAHFYNWQWDIEKIENTTLPLDMVPKEFIDYQREHNEKAKRNPHMYKVMTDKEICYWYTKFIEQNQKWALLKQEYPTTPEEAFQSSGSKLFDLASLEKLAQHTTTPTSEVGSWSFYEDPKPNHNYVLGVDPSEGIGSDHSAIVILDIAKIPKVVATYKDKYISPYLLAYEIANKAKVYNFAFVVVERNNSGWGTLGELKNIYPPDLLYKEEKPEYEDTRTTERLGFHTNGSTKPSMMYQLSNAVSEESIIIPDSTIVHEMRIYDRKELLTTKADPETTNHFDLLMAVALAYQGRGNVILSGTPVTVTNTHDQSSMNSRPSTFDKPTDTQENIGVPQSEFQKPFDPFAAI